MLRIRSDGSIPGPTRSTAGGNARYVWTYGHRNVQGLAFTGQQRAVDGRARPDRDDEVNRILKGRNYGWSPTAGYNENRPMTDKTRYPKAYSAKWRSGSPTVATSGCDLPVRQPVAVLERKLLVAKLKGKGVMVFTVSASRGQDHAVRTTILTGYGADPHGASRVPDGSARTSRPRTAPRRRDLQGGRRR